MCQTQRPIAAAQQALPGRGCRASGAPCRAPPCAALRGGRRRDTLVQGACAGARPLIHTQQLCIGSGWPAVECQHQELHPGTHPGPSCTQPPGSCTSHSPAPCTPRPPVLPITASIISSSLICGMPARPAGAQGTAGSVRASHEVMGGVHRGRKRSWRAALSHTGQECPAGRVGGGPGRRRAHPARRR